MERINIDTLPETNVDWYADGERATAAVLNRPVKQVAGIVNTLIDTVNGQTPINNPTFTGTPTAPTAADGTSTTQLATTAFVQTATNTRIASSEKGAAKGVATLDDTGKVPSTQLPIHYPQPSITGSTVLDGANNNTVWLAGLATALALEVGDVIRIQYSSYDKLHTVEYIGDGKDQVVVNIEHAGNRGNGRLKLPDTTAIVTVTRIAKWYNAPPGLGQLWVNMAGSRVHAVKYTNTTGRPIMVVVSSNIGGAPHSPGCLMELFVDGVQVGRVDTDVMSDGSISAIITSGSEYVAYKSNGSNLTWAELR